VPELHSLTVGRLYPCEFDGDDTASVERGANPSKSLVVIMKDGKVYGRLDETSKVAARSKQDRNRR